ncbi:MAG TPA: 1,4-dihydroxy-2-naphthoate polyprenyltransferase [Cyclobacteriaceae bacterium]
MNKTKAWIIAARPRTIPLALAGIGMGTFLAATEVPIAWDVTVLSLFTATLLQVLSNLANDYGDFKSGVDGENRKGPVRSVQSGVINHLDMKKGIKVMAILSLISGLFLLQTAFSSRLDYYLLFLIVGMLAILSAIAYTNGKKPYGYVGLGDLAVFIFFGICAVVGTYFLHTQSLNLNILLPASSVGFFSVAVLNVNNIRDIESDKMAGKLSIPVRLGKQKAIIYHTFLLTFGLLAACVYTFSKTWQWYEPGYLAVIPLLYKNYKGVSSPNSIKIDPYLKQMAVTTLIFILIFGIALLI